MGQRLHLSSRNKTKTHQALHLGQAAAGYQQELSTGEKNENSSCCIITKGYREEQVFLIKSDLLLVTLGLVKSYRLV